ncbi:MAG TPA: secretion system protein E [Candidatus Syntrophoarchaeum butanivorans]|uniref:Secretion system protein E n=1 Tax=Candidatus Syntropharchaeum butanivorans TaxID=1839936 RepID=A0A1F2P4I9_9EURY|nr:MAG: type II secretion system protein E [Candidatus Syntrophoarchaeum butanivorans]HEC57581.1 secretion system protein E [Candidatus Syntrophoarchaeum butanivorans]
MIQIFRRRVREDPGVSEEFHEMVEYTPSEGVLELERYMLKGGRAMAVILLDEKTKVRSYHLVEPALSYEEKLLLEDLYDTLQDVLSLEDTNGDEKGAVERKDILERDLKNLLKSYGINLSPSSYERILYYLERNFLGYERIDALMDDPWIEDISCDGVNLPIYLYHRKHQNIRTNVSFPDEEVLDAFIIKLSQKGRRHISIGEPLLDATLPDGSRLQATFGREVTSRGSTFTIRKFREDPFTPPELIKCRTFSLEMMAYLWMCIENNKNLIFAGGTASGKTSSLNAVSFFIPPMAKIISIEDTREITLYHENWIPGVTRSAVTKGGEGEVTMFDLLRAALRQRPECIILGEVRGEEGLTLFQAMNTGHTTYSTIHAEDPQSVVNRLENEPINVPPVMLQALDIISVQVQANIGGKRIRRAKELVEIIEIDPQTRNIRINELFRWDPGSDSFIQLGESHKLRAIMKQRGWSRERLNEELDQRRQVLQWMIDKDIMDYRKVAEILQAYHFDPDGTIEAIEEGRDGELLQVV